MRKMVARLKKKKQKKNLVKFRTYTMNWTSQVINDKGLSIYLSLTWSFKLQKQHVQQSVKILQKPFL